MSKVEDSLKNGGYEVTKSGTNPFNNIETEGTPHDPEEDNVGEICTSDIVEEDIKYLEDAEEEDYSDKEDAKKKITVTWTSRMFILIFLFHRPCYYCKYIF